MTHKKEICRWAKSPDGTRVWEKRHNLDIFWFLIARPDWDPSSIYIVNDKHAEVRKQWIDEGKPQIQIKTKTQGWIDVDGEPSWYLHKEYRIKPKEWYEDIPKDGILCWVRSGNRQFADVIIKYYPNDFYPYASSWSSYKQSTPMTKDEAESFIYKGEE